MKVKLSKIIMIVYGSGVLGGFAVAVAGLVLKSRPLMKTGGIVMLTTGALFAIPLIAAVCYFGWQRVASLLKREE